PVADHGPVLLDAVVIDGDRPATDVVAFADVCVPHVTEMGHFGTPSQPGVFDVDETAHFRLRLQPASRTDVCEGAHLGALSHRAILKHRIADSLSVPHRHSGQVRQGTDGTTLADHGSPLQVTSRINHRITADDHIRLNVGVPGLDD